MNKLKIKIVFFFLWIFLLQGEPHKSIVVVSCGYNNEQFYKKNLDSIVGQEYDNYKLIYVDDCSSDKTFDCVQGYFSDENNMQITALLRDVN